jgi:hypothetical protein
MAPNEQSRSTERASRVTIGSATLVMAAAPSGATGFAVTTTADGGTGSLRAALDQANAHPGPDLISLPAGTYTVALAGRGDDANLTGDLDVLDDVLIVGTAGAGATTIDGAGLDRVFDVVGGSLSVQGLTITGGDPGVASLQHGGGIRALGHPVTVLDSVLTANTAHEGGGVYADSTTASFQRSEIVDNLVVSQPGNGSEAGGLDMRGTVVTISDSTIAGNESVLGNSGGIDFIGSPATITNSTISGNKAGNRGGGMSVGGPDSVLTIRHTTFAENSAAGDSGAGGAFVMRGGSVSLQNTLLDELDAPGCGSHLRPRLPVPRHPDLGRRKPGRRHHVRRPHPADRPERRRRHDARPARGQRRPDPHAGSAGGQLGGRCGPVHRGRHDRPAVVRPPSRPVL